MTDKLNGAVEDYRATHNFFNTLYSHFQGWYTLQDVLREFKHPEANAEEASSVKELLDVIIDWRESMRPAKPPMLRADGSSEAFEVVEQALDYMELLFEQLMDVGGMVDMIQQKEGPLKERPQDVAYFVAAYSCMMYTFDNSVSGTIEFGDVFSDEEMMAEGAKHKEQAATSIDSANWMYQGFKDGAFESDDSCSRLEDLVEDLPFGVIKPEVLALSEILKAMGREPWEPEKEPEGITKT